MCCNGWRVMNIASYDGTTPLKMQIVVLGLIKPKCDDKKQSAIIKVSRAALGLPVDTKGGMKTKHPTDITNNIAIFEWLAARVASGMSGIDIIKMGRDLPVTPSTLDEVSTSVIEPTQAEAAAPLDSIDVDESTDDNAVVSLPVVIPSIDAKKLRIVSHLNQSNQFVINADVITDIKNTLALAIDAHEVYAIHASRVGGLLLLVKAELKHGEFSTWIAENFSLSERQAQRYMQAAKGVPPKLRTIVKTDTMSVMNHDVQTESSEADMQIIEIESTATQSQYETDIRILEKKLSDAEDVIEAQKKDLEAATKGNQKGLVNPELEVDDFNHYIEGLSNNDAALQDSMATVSEAIREMKGALNMANECGGIPFGLIEQWQHEYAKFQQVDAIFKGFFNRISNGDVNGFDTVEGELL